MARNSPLGLASEDIDPGFARKAAFRPPVERSPFKGQPSLLQEQWWRWVSHLESERQHFSELTIQVQLTFPSASASRVEEAIRAVVTHHESLRYRFVDESGKLRVYLNSSTDFEVLIKTATSDEIVGLRKEFFALPVPANGQWLVKAAILPHPGGIDALMIINHIVADATSNRMLEAEIQRLVLTGEDAHPDQLQYSDYANWERDWLNNQGKPLIKHWLRWPAHDIALVSPSTGLPLQWSTGSKQSSKLFLPSSWAGEIRKVASRLRTTPFLVYLTAFTMAVAQWSGQYHFLVRNVGDGRWQKSALLPIVGLLTVADPLEARVDPHGDFERTLRNLEAEYRTSMALRLPDIHAFPPGFGVSGKYWNGLANNFAVNVNYMPARPSSHKLDAAGTENCLDLFWPPKIFRMTPVHRAYSVSPIHLFVTEGNRNTAIDFKVNSGLLSSEDQDAIIEGFLRILSGSPSQKLGG